jgi:diguanylate cyclase (GGDEF)-like protein
LNDSEFLDCEKLTNRAAEHFRLYQDRMACNTDKAMAALLLAEWMGAIIAAFCLSPRTWDGTASRIHPHVWLAVFGGLAIVSAPLTLVWLYRGSVASRHVIAAAEMLMSALLIDVTNGRVETHFHIFGSLAFLAFYRDWRVLATASAVTTLDHIVRGIWLPETIYGVMTSSPWRWLEHAFWVIFEDVVLVISSKRSIREMWTVATREAQLWYGAYHDALTGLANRRLLSQRFEDGIANHDPERRTGAVLFIDLDRFKQANDTLGHAVGDKILVEASARMAGVVGNSNTIARVGGDEFVAVIDGLGSPSEAQRIGENLLRTFSNPFVIEGHQLFLSASIGIGLYPENGTRLEELQDLADIAMYEAKAEGRNRVAFFSREMTDRAALRKELERSLAKSIERGEMEVHFQPQIGSDCQVKGFEALLRWNHPVRGFIPPSEFVPIAERTGQIVDLGEWIMYEACRECETWQTAGRARIPVAVNVSAIQLEQPGFAEEVRRILVDTGLHPSLLTLEITETAILKSLKNAGDHLTTLRKIGVKVALDDFGTGYSSLSYLQTLPADTLKLDRAFVVRESANTPTVLRSVIGMAHSLGLRVVAEGVETAEQRDLLWELGCDELQGFYFSKAIPNYSVPGILAKQIEAKVELAFAD